MSALLRTRVGKYKIEEANKFISLEEMFDIDKVQIDDDNCKRFINGISINNYNFFYQGNDELKNKLVYVYYKEQFIGIAEREESNAVMRSLLRIRGIISLLQTLRI